jgi:hypothetical protein
VCRTTPRPRPPTARIPASLLSPIQISDSYISSGTEFAVRTRGNACSHLLTGPPVTLSAPRGLSKARPSIGFPRLITGFWRFTGSILPSGYESPAPIPSSQPQLLFLVSGSQLSALSSVASSPYARRRALLCAPDTPNQMKIVGFYWLGFRHPHSGKRMFPHFDWHLHDTFRTYSPDSPGP